MLAYGVLGAGMPYILGMTAMLLFRPLIRKKNQGKQPAVFIPFLLGLGCYAAVIAISWHGSLVSLSAVAGDNHPYHIMAAGQVASVRKSGMLPVWFPEGKPCRGRIITVGEEEFYFPDAAVPEPGEWVIIEADSDEGAVLRWQRTDPETGAEWSAKYEAEMKTLREQEKQQKAAQKEAREQERQREAEETAGKISIRSVLALCGWAVIGIVSVWGQVPGNPVALRIIEKDREERDGIRGNWIGVVFVTAAVSGSSFFVSGMFDQDWQGWLVPCLCTGGALLYTMYRRAERLELHGEYLIYRYPGGSKRYSIDKDIRGMKLELTANLLNSMEIYTNSGKTLTFTNFFHYGIADMYQKLHRRLRAQEEARERMQLDKDK